MSAAAAATTASAFAAAPAANARAAAPGGGCFRNLLQNGGAEDGFPGGIPGWNNGKPFMSLGRYCPSCALTSALSKRIRGGNQFFAGGSGAPGSPPPKKAYLWQEVDVFECPTCDGYYANTSAYLGGWKDDGDYMTVTTRFLSSRRKSLGSFVIGPVTAAQRKGKSTLFFRSNAVKVPCGTATIRVTLTATTFQSSDDYNDRYGDKVSLRFQP